MSQQGFPRAAPPGASRYPCLWSCSPLVTWLWRRFLGMLALETTLCDVCAPCLRSSFWVPGRGDGASEPASSPAPRCSSYPHGVPHVPTVFLTSPRCSSHPYGVPHVPTVFLTSRGPCAGMAPFFPLTHPHRAAAAEQHQESPRLGVLWENSPWHSLIPSSGMEFHGQP